ncbi:MAG: hypothetical protein UFG06_14000 [Lachnospiraceae bacterium]|nr:hypothetical protein [Lachnospiraceae bacterium]
MINMSDVRNAELEYCRVDIIYYIEEYGHIEDKEATELIQPFKMWDMQKEACKSIMEHKKNAILKARQLGITWLVLHIACWLFHLNTGRTVIALSRSEDEAAEMVRRVGVILYNMPELIADKDNIPPGWDGPVFSKTTMKIEITFADGPMSVFKAFPSSPNAARSFTADLLIFDEWAFQQFAEQIWKAAFPVINRPNSGMVIGLSTIERGSLFEQIFTDPDNGFNKIFIPWYADPNRDDAWYEETKRTLKTDITQEYPATVEEALAVPGGSFFPEVCEKNTISKKPLEGPVTRYVCIDYGFDMFSAHWISVNTSGNAQVYRSYNAPDKTIRAACDILRDLSKDEDIYLFLAPPDLWSRDQVTGKSRALHFAEGGINLTKTSNDFPAGCAGMKAWLEPQDGGQSLLTILEGTAPELYRCLQKIQKDKKRHNVYAKEPHDITHAPDSLRCFCVYYTIAPIGDVNTKKKRWTPDMFEDYENANANDKAYLIEKWGEPEY